MKASQRLFWLWCAALFLASFSFGAIEVAETLLVDLTAEDDTAGDDEWINHGTLGNEGGHFLRIGVPYVEEFDVGTGTPVRAVTFNGVSDAYKCLVNAPAGLTGLDPTRSIEVWAYNPAANDEETMVAWGHRGGGAGTNMSFNYGVHAVWGAVGQWGDFADLPWKPGGGCPELGKWHHLVYTYDGTTTRVYADGALWNFEALGAGTIYTWPDTPIVLGAQIIDGAGNVGFETYAASLSIARARVHDGVLSDAQILNNFNAERNFFGFTGEPPDFVSFPTEDQFFDGDATYTAPVGVTGEPLPILTVLAPAGATVEAAGGGFFTVRYTLPVPAPASFVVSVRASNPSGQAEASWTVTRKSLPPAGTLAVAGELFVKLDARDDTAGDDEWINEGTLGGQGNFLRIGNPVKETVAGVAAVSFNKLGQTDAYQCLVNAPDGLVGLNPTRSIEVWAYNPQIDNEETLVAWGHRGGPQGSNMSFNYGVHALFGAVGHWGEPDIGWNNAGGAPAAGRWHHLVYTYDGTTTRVYADGVLWNSEKVGAGAINTHAGTPIVLASQIESDGFSLATGMRGSLSLARVRVHDGVLAAAEVAHNYNAEKDDFGVPGLGNVPAGDIAYAGDPAIPYRYKLIVSGQPPLLFPVIEPPGATITADGLYSYTIPTPAPASFTVRVRVANPMGFAEASWPVEVRQLPPAGVLAEAGEVFIKLDARDDTAGDDEWINEGSLGEDANFIRIGGAFKEEVAGVEAVTFNAAGPVGDAYQCKIPAPAGLVGIDPTRSIEAWVFNPAVAEEETILAWSHRGGPCGTNMSFNYGYNQYFGAVGHWCHDPGPDIGWTDEGVAPQAGVWHYLVYTYDGAKTCVYADGELWNTEHLGPGVINTYADTPILLAAQWDAVGAMNTVLGGTLSIARVRIHDEVLHAAQIAHNWNVERGEFDLADAAPVFTSAPTSGFFYDGDSVYTAKVAAFGIPAPRYEVVLPAGATITAQGVFTYTLPAPAPASFTVTVQAVNSAGSAQASWIVRKAVGTALARGPVHRYSFAADASDSIGGADGTPYGTVAFTAAGQAALGNTGHQISNAAGVFPDPGDPGKQPPGAYIDLPNGIVSTLGRNATFEAWFTWNGPSSSYWQRIFDFGTSNTGEDWSSGAEVSTYTFLTPLSGGNTMRFGYRTDTTERWVETAVPPIGAETHVAVVWNGDDTTAQLFVNGKKAAEDTATHVQLDMLVDNNNWLGRSQFPDAMFNGSYNEFRIYDYPLSIPEVLGNFEAGPDTVTAGGDIYILMGNVNDDDKVNIADAVALLQYLFAAGKPPVCAKAADTNDDNKLDIADAIKILGYLFSQQSMLAPDHSTVTAATNACKGYAAEGIDGFDGKPYFPAQVSGLPPCAKQCR
ncbi:MAG TPA: hypothetical protein PKX48_04065 [Planctomycetota bacterium]|jgi:hypothetical protein|nr:hypothetical protein [Planctomycetota bacterium]OQC21402.1 MAG: hypothetical protein BWX69_00887 [Planctomycetes bacterium ADurb.Bin069]NMD36186.1 hypothetical protein [Planctomycetota bacterium]HNR97837.1 hypothetical protein [Planctomycetota bacterium]HNU24696.1 hypothetical protein [Planctomycetota bacterium]